MNSIPMHLLLSSLNWNPRGHGIADGLERDLTVVVATSASSGVGLQLYPPGSLTQTSTSLQ